MKHFTLRIPSIMCIACVNTIKSALLTEFPDLKIIRFNEGTKLLEIKFSKKSLITLSRIMNEIDAIGHEVDKKDIINHAQLTHNANKEKADVKEQEADTLTRLTQKQSLYKFLVSAGLGLSLLLLSALGVTLPFFGMLIVSALSFCVMIYAGADIFKRGFKGLLHTKKPNMDTLFSISTLAAFSVSFAALFMPALPVEFASALLIFSSRHLGRYIESHMKEKVKNTVNLKSNLPKNVQLITQYNIQGLQKNKSISTKDIKKGDIICLTKGDYFPADGKLLSPHAHIYKTFIDGGLLPCLEHKGASVYAGTQVADNNIYFKVTKTLEHAYLTRFEQRLKKSQEDPSKAKIEAFTDQVIKYFIPAVLIIATVVVAVALPLYGPLIALHSAIAILVGACPCTLGFITPLAMSVGMNKSAKHGAFIDKRETLEMANKIKTIVFDLNGTITQGKSEVSSLLLHDHSLNKQKIHQLLLALENKVSKDHLIGGAIKHYAQSELGEGNEKDLPNVTAFIENKFSGIQGTIENDIYHLGNETLLKQLNITLQENKPNRQYLLKNNQIIAQLDIIDPIHKDAIETIKALQKENFEVILLSGASDDTVNYFARKLNITQYVANCRGDKKAEYIKKLQANGPVAMVGDAVNDQIALTTAELGIAVASADQYSKSSAKVIINKEGLQPVAHFFKNCKNTLSILKQNLLSSLLYNAVVMTCTMTITLSLGSMAPAIMAASMGLQSLLILANTYRLSLMPLSHEPANEIEKLPPTKITDETKTPLAFSAPSIQCKLSTQHSSSFWSALSFSSKEISEPLPSSCCGLSKK